MFGRKKRGIERLLLVEDEPLVAFDNEHLLSDAGYTIVATVDRVSDAIEQINTHDGEIDLVVADINLADGSGMDVAHAARAAGIAVLFVTGQCPIGAESAAAGCLSKPYPPRALLAAIDAIDGALQGRPPKRLPIGFRLFAGQQTDGNVDDVPGSLRRP